MKTYCENPLCESESVKEVPVSVHKPGDQKRSLCATCTEAYTWGVQHGRKSEKTGSFSTIERFLRRGGFIVISQNRHDPHPALSFEAWAYQGPLDFIAAKPMTFGLGGNVIDSLAALNQQLKKSQHFSDRTQIRPGMVVEPPPQETAPEPLWRVVYVIDVNAPDTKTAADLAHHIMMDPGSMAPILDIIDAQGKVTRVDLLGAESNRGKE